MKIYSFLLGILFFVVSNVVMASSPPTGTPCISIKVTKNATIKINMASILSGTDVWVETSKGKYKKISVDTNWTNFVNYTAGDTIIKIHGNITRFNCNGNNTKITGLNFKNCFKKLIELVCSNNQISSLDLTPIKNLTYLYCQRNQLKQLNISGLTNIIELGCSDNKLKNLDIKELTNLKKIGCSKNQLNSLDMSKLTNLTTLNCKKNKFKKLDVSKLTKLSELYCSDNLLENLNLKGLDQLTEIYCFGNNFNTQAVNDIYCALPNCEISDKAKLYIANNTSETNHADILGSNAKNARNKNWQVLYYIDNKDVNTTGNYACGSHKIAENQASKYLLLYPNPANNVLRVELSKKLDANHIDILDLSGKIIISKPINNPTINVDVSGITQGIYLVRVGAAIQKLVIQ